MDAAVRWLPIPGWEGLYEVSDQGQVRSLDRVVTERNTGVVRSIKGRVMTPTLHRGDQSVTLSRFGRNERYAKVHHLVLEAFVGPRPEGLECCHADGDFTNNRLENLRWDTSTENNLDQVRHGNHYWAKRTHCKHGHEYTPANTYLRSGHRHCMTCMRERGRRYQEQNRARAKEGAK